MLEEEIMERLQLIAGIFVAKGIAVMPVGADYIYTKLAPDMEVLIMQELIMELQELFDEYKRLNKTDCKYSAYVGIFRDCLLDNSSENVIVSRKIA